MKFRISPPWDDPAVIISLIVVVVVSSILLVTIVACVYLARKKCKRKEWEKLTEEAEDDEDDEKEFLLDKEKLPLTSNFKPSYKNLVAYLGTLRGQKYARVPSFEEEKKIDFVVPPLLTRAKMLPSQPCAKVENCYTCRNNIDEKESLSKRLSNSSDSLDVNLYKRRGSLDELGDAAENEGRICVSLKYDNENQVLTINIIKAAYLRPYGIKDTADAFVKIEVSDGKKSEQKSTKVIRGTRSPVFNESFVFSLTADDLAIKTLTLTVCDYDKFSRQVAIGSVTLPLSDVEEIQESKKGTEELWWDLEKHIEGKTYQGELMLSLCHMPERCMIKMNIMRAKALKLKRRGSQETGSSIYVKASVLFQDKVVASKYTHMNSDHVCPMFNEELEFRYDHKNTLSETYLVFTLCTKTTFGIRRLVGKTVIGPSDYATGSGYNHWADMVAAPYSMVAQWHILR